MSYADDHLIPLVDEGLGNSAYLADLGGGRALAVDASRDLRALRQAAARRGLTVAFAADTHLHADFLSGAVQLAVGEGPAVLASAAGRRAFPHTALADGDEVDLGGLTLRALATPGHTDEHLSYLLLDGDRELGAFTGGSLIVGSAARTDLLGADRAGQLARAQYRSLRRLAMLPDATAVWPTHGAGSFCSAPPGAARVTTIGAEKTANPLLAAPDEDAFARALLASLGSYPAYFARLAEVNRRGPALIAAAPGLAPLTPAAVRSLADHGGWVVDVRPVADFAAGHIPGAVSIPLRDQFATWLGWLVPDDVPLGFVLAPGQDPAEVAWQALKIGYEDLAGQLAGGMAAWLASGGPAERTELVTAARMDGRAVLDVRQDGEYAAGHVPGAVHVELGDLPARIQAVPAGAVVMCGHGERGHDRRQPAAAGRPPRPGRAGRRRPRLGCRHRAAPAGGAVTQPGRTRSTAAAGGGQEDVRLGLRVNLAQFVLLAVVNFFVGGMVGLERTVTPLVGSEQYHLGAIAISAFVVVFGLTKAITNAVGGALTGRYTRKSILVAGWLIGLPVPFMLAYGPSWAWVIAANVLLGVNQGLTWSMTVNMKIDLIGPGRRGVALGINETAGYLGVAVTALATGYLATGFGLRPAPELLGAGYAAAGLALSVLAVRDTAAWARAEARQHPRQAGPQPPFREIARRVSWTDRTLAAASQAGLVNNLNDGLVWVVMPVLLVAHGVSVTGVGYIKALYPFMWAAGMIATGHLADRIGRKPPIVAGMLIQAAGLAVITAGISHALPAGLAGAFLLGTGTALVYPSLLAAVSDATHPSWRAGALGIYRFWRDAGYAIGALIGGITAALASLDAAILVATILTAASGLLAWAVMDETHPGPHAGRGPPP